MHQTQQAYIFAGGWQKVTAIIIWYLDFQKKVL